jgi:hypothetical protein
MDIALSGSIREKISFAEKEYRNHGRRLMKDPSVAELLKALEKAIEASHSAMTKSGILRICRSCDREEGGACCGAGLEARYDGWMLLTNRLMGVELPQRRKDPSSCFFLGEDGCRLKARHVICINYVCNRITAQVGSERLSLLREKEGIELQHLFLIIERLKGCLKRMRVSRQVGL